MADYKGGRPPYEGLPTPLQRWVERELGSSVASSSTQSGGFSPGVAARVVTSSGMRAFIKAIATERHGPTARLHRREVEAMSAIPRSPYVPGLYATYDDGNWVALLLEDIDGRHPAAWVESDLRRVAAAVTSLSSAFTPSPWREAEPLQQTRRVRTRWWARADVEGLPDWVCKHRAELIALDQRTPSIVEGHTLCHRDLQAENIFITKAGHVRFIDWAWACKAPVWADTMQLACNVASIRSPRELDTLITTSPHTAPVDPSILTAYLVNLAGSAYAKAQQSGSDTIPALQAFRRARVDVLLGWIRHRLGW